VVQRGVNRSLEPSKAGRELQEEVDAVLDQHQPGQHAFCVVNCCRSIGFPSVHRSALALVRY
jgi:hypothetical protein